MTDYETVKYQGETIRLETPVLDAEGAAADLTGAICRLIYQTRAATPVEVDITPVGNLLSYDITPEVSALMLGPYQYGFWVRDGIDQDRAAFGRFVVKEGPGPLITP